MRNVIAGVLFWLGVAVGVAGADTGAVGFRVVHLDDASRQVRPAIDFEGTLTPSPRDYPVQVAIWYPAVTGTGQPMSVIDYSAWAQNKEASRPLTDEDRARSAQSLTFIRTILLNKEPSQPAPPRTASWPEARARHQADALPGPFPLVVAGTDGSISSVAALAERLAAAGFVVVATPSLSHEATWQVTSPARAIESRARTLEFVSAWAAHDLPQADAHRRVLLGVNFDGMAAVASELRNMQARAVVSLDGWEGKQSNADTLPALPFYDRRHLRVPYLTLQQADAIGGLAPSLALFDQLAFSMRRYAIVRGLGHPHYVGPTATLWDEMPAEARASLEVVYTAVVQFVRAAVDSGHGRGADASLDRLKADGRLVRDERRDASPPAPIDAEVEALVMRGPPAEAAARLRTLMARSPGVPLFTERTMSLFAFRWSRRASLTEALPLHALGVEAFPGSLDARLRLIDALREAGRQEDARQALDVARAYLDSPGGQGQDRAGWEKALLSRQASLSPGQTRPE